MQLRISLTLLSAFFLSELVFSRPQYAIRNKIISCMACHYNPAGGGPRNIFGKSALTHRGGNLSEYSKQDLVHIDYRVINIRPQKEVKKNAAGSGIMSSSASIAVPILQKKDGSDIHTILTYDFGGFAKGMRENFVRKTVPTPELSSILFGKFNIPFGLLTDEHRAYVRKQSNTSLNSFEMGAMLSGDPRYDIHYDFAIVEGYQKGGSYPDAGENYGAILNIRTNFDNSPVTAGISALSYHGQIDSSEGTVKKKDPWAISLYGGFSLDAITDNLIKGSLIFESGWAKFFNRSDYNSGIATFINSSASPTYAEEVEDKQSIGVLVRLDIELTKKWNLFYKYDLFAPDQGYFKDQYTLNTIGGKYFYTPNIDFDIRYEKAEIKRDGIKKTGVSSGKDKILILGRLWI